MIEINVVHETFHGMSGLWATGQEPTAGHVPLEEVDNTA
jgi:hypothetical protein